MGSFLFIYCTIAATFVVQVFGDHATVGKFFIYILKMNSCETQSMGNRRSGEAFWMHLLGSTWQENIFFTVSKCQNKIELMDTYVTMLGW